MKPAMSIIHKEPKREQRNCATHGNFESVCYIGESWSKCPACADEELARHEADERSKEERERIAAWQRKVGSSGIPARFQDRTLETYEATNDGQRKAHDFARQYADDFESVRKTGRSAILIGKPGTGKTHLAVGIALHVLKHHRKTVLFTSVMRAIRYVKDAWGKGAKYTETDAIAYIASPDLLILDEVGVQFGSEAEKLILFDVLNERYENRRPTLLLANVTPDECKAYLGERIMDRLREDGGRFIPFTWESHRA